MAASLAVLVELVKIHGPGLNSNASPERARRILGSRWANRTCLCTVLAIRRGGVLHVRLPTGEEAYVNPTHVVPDDPSSESEREDNIDTEDLELDLGSEGELEDGDLEDDQQADSGESTRWVREADSDWDVAHITQDQRLREGFHAPRPGRMKMVEWLALTRIFPFFYCFLPIPELQEAIALMDCKGKEKYGESFTLNLDIFL